MFTRRIVLTVSLAVLLTTGSLLGHHAFGSMFDGNKVVRQKGVIVLLAKLNPHSLIFVDSTDANGTVEHWVLEVSAMNQLAQRQMGDNTLKPGAAIEFCGYATKDGVAPLRSWQSPEPISLSLKSIPRPVHTGRLIAPESIIVDGVQRGASIRASQCQ